MTADFPQLAAIAVTLLTPALTTMALVALDESGQCRASRSCREPGGAGRVRAFDLLFLDGRSLLKVKYRDRRALLGSARQGTKSPQPEQIPGDMAALVYSRGGGRGRQKCDSHRTGCPVVGVDQDKSIGGWRHRRS